jgi:hypothetical protein
MRAPCHLPVGLAVTWVSQGDFLLRDVPMDLESHPGYDLRKSRVSPQRVQ